MSAHVEGAAIRLAIGARHLELHGAGVRQSNVRRRLLGHLRDHALEDVAGVHDLIALERLERRASFDPHPMRRQQRLERIVSFSNFRAGDVRGESIAATGVGFDVLRPEHSTQPGDRLFEAVVRDGDAAPRGLDQGVLREDLPRPRREDVEQIELARAKRDRLVLMEKAPGFEIELKLAE